MSCKAIMDDAQKTTEYKEFIYERLTNADRISFPRTFYSFQSFPSHINSHHLIHEITSATFNLHHSNLPCL